MRTVNVAKLKNELSKYLRFAKSGEEVVIHDRSLPIAKLVPFTSDDATEEELQLVAAGKMRLPKAKVDLKQILKISVGRVKGNRAIEALLEDREGR